MLPLDRLSVKASLFFFFFLRGHGNESCSLIGSLSGQYFLSLPTGHGNAFVSRRVHLYFRCHFFKCFSFSEWAVFLSKHVGHYLKPINNLSILSFLSIKSPWLTEKYWFENEFVEAIVSLSDKRN